MKVVNNTRPGLFSSTKRRLGASMTKDNLAFLVLLAPFIILFFLFIVLPVLSSIVLSFTDYDMITSPKFVGLDNYIRMFSEDDVFPTVMGNTLAFAVVLGPLSYIISFVLAWFINELNPFMRNVLSFMFYAPALVGNAYYIWQIAFSGDSYGYVNSMLLSMGFITDPIQWLKDPSYNFILIVIIQVWMSMGVSFLANIAGLQSANPELYEAGAIDGIRTRWHELWYITLPSMKSILLFGAVIEIQNCFSVGGLIQQLVGYPSTNNSVDTIVLHINDVGTMRYEMGYAAALSVFLFVIMAFCKLLVDKAINSVGK